jgi:hypothetical protein
MIRRVAYKESINRWRKEVFKRNNYTCKCCGKRGSIYLNAHHLDGYNWCKEKRFDVGKNNGTIDRT